jgi:GIY-YIG catalytic domain-containing protein/zinc knuckle protein
MDKSYFIYILKLENDKYYVGKTKNPDIRLNDHFNKKGAQWTQLYKPIEILEIISNCDIYDEDKYTFKYMAKYGIDNVRGGSFIQVELNNNYKNVIQHVLYSTNDICYVCQKNGHMGSDCKNKIISNIEIKKEPILEEKSNMIICTRCKRLNHLKEKCNFKTFANGKKIIKSKYKPQQI